jgi:hypothetical protein
MRGRPKRVSNPALCDALEKRRERLGMSLSETATAINVHPSSLIRALRAKALSPDMALAFQNFIQEPAAPTIGNDETREALLLLREFVNMFPRLHTALDILVKGVQVVK